MIFTQRYWALQTSGTNNNWELARSLVEAEIKEQSERLLCEKALLDEGQTRWNGAVSWSPTRRHLSTARDSGTGTRRRISDYATTQSRS